MDHPSNPTPEVWLLRTFGASLAVLFAGLVLLFAATQGGQSFTTETVRRQQTSERPQALDAFNLTRASGEKTNLHTVLASGGKVWIVDFVYTRCQSVCSALGTIYQQLQTYIEAEGLQGRVGLLSISFDPTNDNVAALQDYAKRMRMNPAVWQIATLTDWQDRRRLLDEFGIMVIPAPLGEYEHNAALHVVNSDGMLIKIIDYLDYKTAIGTALASRESGASLLPTNLRYSP